MIPTSSYRLFDYIQGKNKYEQQIEMTAPVITEVLPSDRPFYESSFTREFKLELCAIVIKGGNY